MVKDEGNKPFFVYMKGGDAVIVSCETKNKIGANCFYV